MAVTRVRLYLILAVGFILRLVFISSEGFKNDISSFESWALTLASHPLSQFYSKAGFADYPPGYFYVLWAVGHIYAPFAQAGDLPLLKWLVKMPAILMDLVDGALLFALVRRFASDRWALAAAALFVFNPAMIFISAVCGQVDSIAAGLALLAVYLVLRSGDEQEGFSWPIFGAWIAIASSMLVKPQAALLVPLFLVFAFVSPQQLRRRLTATAAGIAGALLLAYIVAVPFHPAADPVAVFRWLYEKYEFGKNVYPFNSVNAFNLWTIKWPFWQPDSQTVWFLPQWAWGLLLLGAASILTLVRYAQIRTDRALLESAALLELAFYMLSTRMHERYVFDGLTFVIAAIPFARRYLWSALILSTTLFVNLGYSYYYLTVVTKHVPNVNPFDLIPIVTHPLSLLNVLVFFFLGYVFLGSDAGADAMARPYAADLPKPRTWFDPREGLASMRWPLDYLAAGAIGAFSFVLSFVNYWLPNKKYFDEIYFARAAEEYLTHKYIYENTHPPLTKLIITLSTMLFGGMHGGDNPHGWRFLDVLFGAIVVVILYAFAKRITRSTLFASCAALLLTFDGMHFVQSRIATPEGIVIVFSLGTLYAFYRYWIASQSTVRRYEGLRRGDRIFYSGLAAAVGGFALSALVCVPTHQSRAAFVVTGLYFALGIYLLVRLWLVPKILGASGDFASYPDGSFLLRDGQASRLHTADGGSIDSARKTPAAGTLTQADRRGLVLRDEDLEIAYDRAGTAAYRTPVGTAVFSPGLLENESGEREQGRHATAWLVAFTVLLGLLVGSKWYGVMAYGVSFVVIIGVWLQRYLNPKRAKVWGNPFGFRLDVALTAIVFISMTVYVLIWIPDFIRQIEIKNITDLVYRQYTMFEYHDTLKATHPYQSVWWQWPLDLRPIAYYWNDLRSGLNASLPNACCVAEIISLPNPILLWFGLFTVPVVGYLGWRERDKGYALLVLAYLLQWLPWSRSPRITFAYHFYVDIPLICLCNAIVLQRLWHWGDFNKDAQLFSRIGVAAYVVAVGVAFVWFYPILAGVPLHWDQWNARMWHGLMGNDWI